MSTQLDQSIGDPCQHLRQHLRSATHDAHVRLNRHLLLAGLTKPGYPESLYRTVLVAYYHVYRELESRIRARLTACAHPFDYGPREKWPWLVADLAWFGENPELRRPPAACAVPGIVSDAALAGVLYTLEGSTLGGQVISAHLAQHQGLSAEGGARFFSGYGAQTEARWGQFWQWAVAVCPDHRSCREAADAAGATFAYLEGVLDYYAAVAA